MSLEEVFQFIEAKEAGKRSASRLSQSQGIDAANSQYHLAKQDEIKLCKAGDDNEPCSYCIKRGHGKKEPPTRLRRTDCPAYGTVCNKCGWQNHFASVCCGKGKITRPQQPTPPSGNTRETENAIFDSLCATTNLGTDPGKGAISLDHHLILPPNRLLGQKAIQATTIHHTHSICPPRRLHSSGMQTPTSRLAPVRISAMAHTGCQNCLASIKVIRRLGLCESDLIPVTMQMHAVNNNGIKILGAVILRFSGRSPSGKTLES